MSRIRRARTATLAACATALTAMPAWPQDASAPLSQLPLRTTLNAATAPATASTGTGPGSATLGDLTDVPGAAPRLRAGTSNARLRRPSVRRTRNPTTMPVHAQIRPTIGGADRVTVDVQPAQTGLPDPAVIATAPRPRTVPDDPYAQLGIRLGGLMLYPTIGESVGYDTNPNRTTVRRGSFVSLTEGELRLQSDWSSHELSGFLRGGYNEYPRVSEASRPEGSGRLGLRLDVQRDTQVNIEGHYLIDTQRSDSTELGTTVRSRPVVFTEGGSVGVTQRFNRVVASLTGTIDRADYENARSVAGTVIDQSDRDLTQYGLRGRLGYEVMPGLTPFVEGLGDTRVYDRRVDFSGYRRDSDGVGGRLGTTFEITRLVTGEVAAGAIHRTYDDRRLGSLTSPLVDASLVWSASPLTAVRASAQATVDETTIAGATGVRTTRGTIEVSHDLRRNLNLTGGFTISNYDYQGVSLTERGYGAFVRADYRLTRWLGVRASYNFEKLDSPVPTSNYTSNVFLVGMRYTP